MIAIECQIRTNWIQIIQQNYILIPVSSFLRVKWTEGERKWEFGGKEIMRLPFKRDNQSKDEEENGLPTQFPVSEKRQELSGNSILLHSSM